MQISLLAFFVGLYLSTYTLSGHILHPGEVRRCIELDDCDNIIVKNTGVDFTELGDTPLGLSPEKILI